MENKKEKHKEIVYDTVNERFIMKKVKYFPVIYSKRTYCVYVHVNKVNGRKYFGITKGYPKNRWGNGSGYINCTKFYPAIKKYGWDGFYHIVIINKLSAEEAAFLERSYIRIFNTTNREFGYNTDEGGKLSVVSARVKRKLIAERRMRPIICLETMQRYESQAELASMEGKGHSYVHDACRSKGSRVHNGKHYLYIEDYVKMSPREVQDIIDGKLQNHQEVVCMETGEVFWDATKAGQTLTCGKYSVSNRCNHFKERGKDNFAGGFHWAFKEDYEKLSFEEIERVINLDNFKVVCIETKEVYENPIVAARETGADEGCIRRCCQGTLRHSKGFHWMYEKNYKKATEEDIERIFNKPRKEIESSRIKSVVCIETGKVYKTIVEAVKDTGVSGLSISKSCKLGNKYHSRGFHWMFKEDYDRATSEEIRGRLKKEKIPSKRAKPVICIENEKIYKSASEVKQKNYGNIVTCCRKNKEEFLRYGRAHFTAEGFHWFFYDDFGLLEGCNKEDLFKIENSGLFKSKKIICLETKKIYENRKEVSSFLKCSPDTVQKICVGRNKFFRGKHWMYYEDYIRKTSEELNEIMSTSEKDTGTSVNFYKGVTKVVVNITRGKVYKSCREASEDIMCSSESIRSACLKNHVFKGEIWFYQEDVDKIGEEKVNEMIREITQKRDVRVICIETKEIFKNSKEARKKYKTTSDSCISACCIGNDPNRLTAGGVHWMYYKDYLKATPEEIQKKLNKRQGQAVSKAVIKLETLEVFSSIEEASAKIKLSNKTIRHSCTGESVTNPKNGHWMFKEDYDRATPQEIEERLKRRIKAYNRRKVKCVETGEVFNSLAEANISIGGCSNNSMISKCCRCPDVTYKGYHWEYV